MESLRKCDGCVAGEDALSSNVISSEAHEIANFKTMPLALQLTLPLFLKALIFSLLLPSWCFPLTIILTERGGVTVYKHLGIECQERSIHRPSLCRRRSRLLGPQFACLVGLKSIAIDDGA